MITDINELMVGDKVYPLFGLDKPYVASVNPYYILHIDGDVITWSYGNNCLATKFKFGHYRLFKSLDDAYNFCELEEN